MLGLRLIRAAAAVSLGIVLPAGVALIAAGVPAVGWGLFAAGLAWTAIAAAAAEVTGR